MALAEAGHGVAVIPSAQRADRYALRIQAITYRGQRLRERLTILWAKRRTLPPFAAAAGTCGQGTHNGSFPLRGRQVIPPLNRLPVKVQIVWRAHAIKSSSLELLRVRR